jgi:dipeptidyl aminopeptidase/acylaminoacyl peptidase
MMAQRFRETGVEHEFISVPDGGHGLNNIDRAERDRIYRRAAAFLAQHL